MYMGTRGGQVIILKAKPPNELGPNTTISTSVHDNFKKNAHVVAADDVEAQGHLLDAGGRGEDALVAVLQDDVGRLVEALEHALFDGASGKDWTELEASMRLVEWWLGLNKCAAHFAKARTYHDVAAVVRDDADHACENKRGSVGRT